MSLSRLSPVFRAIAEDPFFARLPTLFNEPFFNEVARPAMARLPSLRVPALDVKEQDTSFLVEAEVPGVAKKGMTRIRIENVGTRFKNKQQLIFPSPFHYCRH